MGPRGVGSWGLPFWAEAARPFLLLRPKVPQDEQVPKAGGGGVAIIVIGAGSSSSGAGGQRGPCLRYRCGLANVMEQRACIIEDFRGVITRYDNTACTLPAAVCLVSAILW